jgi:hypothetical protein
MRYLPWPIQNALDNRVTQGPGAPEQYWDEAMSPRQRNAADIWIMRHRRDVLEECGQGPQRWRFVRLIEALYAEYQEEKAAETPKA